jgi:hypothetical protein
MRSSLLNLERKALEVEPIFLEEAMSAPSLVDAPSRLENLVGNFHGPFSDTLQQMIEILALQ